MISNLKSLFTKAISLLIICAMVTVSLSNVANARFISPDNWDPTMPGVGTNRYAYAGNDPVNKSDPNGHFWGVAIGIIGGIIGSLLGGTTPANAPGPNDKAQSLSGGQQLAGMAAGAAAGLKTGKLVGDVVGAYAKKKSKEEEKSITTETSKVVNTQKLSIDRNLEPGDLGIKGKIESLKGTVKVKDGIVTVRIDLVKGKIDNPLEVMNNLTKMAKDYGANTLNIEGTFANSRLMDVVGRRYGMVTDGANDVVSIFLK